MVQLQELQHTLGQLQPEIEELKEALALPQLEERLKELDKQAASPNFWDNSETSQKVLQQAKIYRDKIESFGKLESMWQDTVDLVDIALEMEDESVVGEVQTAVKELASQLESQTLATLLSGEYDTHNAILSFHAGSGGTEAQDWAEMLYRMYTRWAEQKGYKYKILNYLDGDEAGLKSATILIEGPYVYGFLRSEAGVHRLVRISPFDSSGRRHTSFASVEVMPEIDDDVTVEIDEKDLRIDTYRASGAGGQHVNMTDSAVRITHLPTGVVVSCQNERSQRQNRETAMKMLLSRLVEIKEREQLERVQDIKGNYKEITWGSQIRSYVFMPYTMVKDHRTNHEEGNVEKVMDGDLDPFIHAYLRDKSLGKL